MSEEAGSAVQRHPLTGGARCVSRRSAECHGCSMERWENNSSQPRRFLAQEGSNRIKRCAQPRSLRHAARVQLFGVGGDTIIMHTMAG